MADDRPGTEVGMCRQSAKRIRNRVQRGRWGKDGSCRSVVQSPSVQPAVAEKGLVMIAVDDLRIDRGWNPIYEALSVMAILPLNIYVQFIPSRSIEMGLFPNLLGFKHPLS